jgi:hypothetical protein
MPDPALQTLPYPRPTLGYIAVKEWLLPVSLLGIGLAIGYYMGKVK